MKKQILGLVAAGMAMANMTAPVAAASVTTQQEQGTERQSNRREQAPMRIAAPTMHMQFRNMFGGFGNPTHKASRHLNQRQYRKLVRQNPHLRKSRKHRSKN